MSFAKNLYQSQLTTPKSPWYQVDSLTASQAALAVGARDYTSVAALAATKTIIIPIPIEANGMQLRFQTNANADAHVVQGLVIAHNTMVGGDIDSFLLGTILTLTGGTQVGTDSNVFVHKIVASDGVFAGTVLDSGNNRIAVYDTDVKGYGIIVFHATTFQAATTLRADVRWY